MSEDERQANAAIERQDMLRDAIYELAEREGKAFRLLPENPLVVVHAMFAAAYRLAVSHDIVNDFIASAALSVSTLSEETRKKRKG